MLSVPSGFVLPAKFRRPGRAAATALMLVALLAGCARAATAAIDVPVDPGVAQTKAGALRGTVAADHRYFAGIPYAAPPVGPLRWQPPAPMPSWTGFRDATRPGPRCIQDVSNDVDGRRTSEDCLTLNVWTPPPSDEPRPVMVWIHGGSFINGSGDIYNARRLASRGDIVVVTINYRLGALGFLAHPALGPAGDVGNYGLADQQAALRWVHDNIAGFGGDPDKVTIAGESAGGMSVCDHLVAPGSEGLFSAAIIQSGPCQAQYDLPAAERASLQYAAEAGCGDPATAAQCLRALPPDTLQKAAVLRPHRHRAIERSGDWHEDPARRSHDRRRRRSRGPGAGGDRHHSRRVQPFHRAAVCPRTRDRCRPLSGVAVRGVRSGCRRGRAPLSAGAVRRQCAAGVFGRHDRRCLRMRGRPDGRRAVRGRARLLVCVRRSRARRHRSRCARRRFPSARAIRWNCAICSTWAERRH